MTAEGTNILLDYGVLLGRKGDPPLYPLHVRPKDVDSVIISHAHLDHSGFVPALFVSGTTEVYATPPTLDLSRLLIEDMLKIEKSYHPFDIAEINKMMNNAKEIPYKEKIKKGEMYFELRESGHVIGGSTVIVEHGKKRLL